MPNREAEHAGVYGKSFALYGRKDIEEFTGFLEQRLAINGLDARELFEGKRCLDAGCGNGRGALLMLKNGAASVTAVDISEENLASTERNLTDFGFSAFDTCRASLESLPYADETFDFVWCNGVLMHTANPDACLAELARVTKIGGKSWLYVYGSGGLYWYMVDHFRRWFADLSADELLGRFKAMNLSPRYIGEYMDDWKVPYLRGYSAENFECALASHGFSCERLWRGVGYDTSERLIKFPRDDVWLGEGDLRYLSRKIRKPSEAVPMCDEMGTFAPRLEQEFGWRLRTLGSRIEGDVDLALMTAAGIQRKLRDTMTLDEPLNIGAFLGFIDGQIRAL